MSAYETPHLFASLDSLEGVPDFFEPRTKPAARAGVQAAAHDALGWMGAVLPGVGLAVLLALLGSEVSDWLGTRLLGFKESPISPIIIAVVLGLIIRNTIGVPATYEKGLRLCLKGVLRLGIVLLGLRLGLASAGHAGKFGLPLIVATITTALLAVTWLNNRLGLSRRLGALIAVGTSICGVSAIVATGAAIEAEEDEMSYAVACITIFGLMGLFAYPFYSHWIFGGNAMQAGLFMGTSIHDVSQTAGAGLMYQQQFGGKEALDTAVVVKLMRNVTMAALIPLMTVLYRRKDGKETGAKKGRMRIAQFVPFFILAFLAMVVLRSVGDSLVRSYGPGVQQDWAAAIAHANNGALWCLMLAMAAVGLGTGLSKLKNLGFKPFCVGLAAAFLVAAVSTGVVKLMAPLIH